MNDIATMTLDQTRAAAQELLDSTTGDLEGEHAERFQALTQRAEQIREQERQRTTAARDLVQRVASGELRTEGEGRSLPGYGRPRHRRRGPLTRGAAARRRHAHPRPPRQERLDCPPGAPRRSRI